MTLWIVAGAVCVVLFALAWWSSGRSKRAAIDPRRSLQQSEAYFQSHVTNSRYDPRGP